MAQPAQTQTPLSTYIDGPQEDAPATEQTGAVVRLVKWSKEDNLVGEMNKADMDQLKMDLTNQYGSDMLSMKDWLKKYKNAFDLAKMKTHAELKQKPFEGAAKVMAPYVMESAIEFNARLVAETISTRTPIYAEVFGKDTDAKTDRAQRVGDYMNYKLANNKFWRKDTDQEFMSIPIIGTTYKKSYYDPHKGENQSRLIMANKVIFSHDAPTFEEAPLITHELTYTRNDIAANVNSGLWEMEDRDKLDEKATTFEFREYHYWYDMDDDGFEEPYIATYCLESDEIVRIVARYDEESIRDVDGDIVDIEPEEYFTQKILIPDPEGKPYGLGWGILLYDIYDTINTNIRQLIDAGTLANSASNTGVVAANLAPMLNQPGRMQEGTIELEMGRFRTIQTSSGSSLRDSFIQMPFAGPQPALFDLMKYLEEGARRMSVASFSIDANPGEAAMLYLARLQQALKAPNTMVWRVYEGLTEEYKKLQKLFYKFGNNEDYNRVLDDYQMVTPQQDQQQPGQPPQAAPQQPPQQQMQPVEHNIKRDFDYRDCDIRPTADPSKGSEVERSIKAQTLDQLMDRPFAQGVLNAREIVKRTLEAMNETDLETLMPPPPPPQPDPLLEMQKAFQQAEFAIRDRETRVKEQDVAIKQAKQALEAQKILVELGQADKITEAEVANKVADTLKKVAEAAALDMQNGLGALQDAKVTLITDNGDELNGAITAPAAVPASPAIASPANQPGRPSPMAGPPGNQNLY